MHMYYNRMKGYLVIGPVTHLHPESRKNSFVQHLLMQHICVHLKFLYTRLEIGLVSSYKTEDERWSKSYLSYRQ